MNLDTNNHSVFSLHYHLILFIKYRIKVINDEKSFRLKEIFEKIMPNYNISLVEWNHDEDHIHILFKVHPNSELSKEIKRNLWKEHFWSNSFCLITTSGASLEDIR